MPGVPFIHYGDEIMMRNVRGLPSVEGSREIRSSTRTPMQWDNTASVGFSTASPGKLYLPIYTNNGKLTVASQDTDPNSVLNYVRTLNKLRHEYPALGNDGDWINLSDPEIPYPWIYMCEGKSGKFVIALNPSNKTMKAKVNIPEENFNELLSNGKVKILKNKDIAEFQLGGCPSAVFKVE